MFSKILPRICGLLCAISLLAAMTPAALASGEPPTAEPVEAEAPAAEAAEEVPVPEPDGDPMEKRTIWLDGASGTKHYSDFTPRALEGETLRRGIDVSSWQNSINWEKVAADGVDFAIVRVGYRTYGTGKLNTDSYYAQNLRGARAAGVRVGAYIFSQAITIEEAVEEADYILSLLQGFELDLPVVFDFEYVDGGRLSSRLGKRTSTDICLAFCERVEAAGYESMVYANLNTLKNCLYPEEFSRIWLAHYTAKTSFTQAKYEYWQCSDSGIISGVNGPTDMDFWFEPTGPAVTPSPAPDPLQPDTPEETAAPILPFTDVPEGAWFRDCVRRAFLAGVVSGTSETSFSPFATATRGQVTTMIYRMEGSPAYSKAAAFTDLTQEYYIKAISWAAEKGVVTGYSETSFRPDREITREELVAILYRMAGSPETAGTLDGFSDGGAVQTWARDAMRWAVQNRIISGYEDGTIRPQGRANRAEVCAILMRYAAL